jgi:hypothetical protein
MLRAISRSLLLALAVVAFALPAMAQIPHPHYLHALSDLRVARALLERPEEYNVMVDQSHAVQAITKALGELSRASINDGVDPRSFAPPPADARLDHRGRLNKVRSLLDAALRDLSYEEDNMAALGWRNAAVRQVQVAQSFVIKAIKDKRWDNMMAQ